jgi:hypothetical protein
LKAFMRNIHHLLISFPAIFLLVACGTQTPPDAWTVYNAANDTLVNPNFSSYSFEYPSYWELKEDSNNITFASESKLLQDAPEKLSPGQLIVGLSIAQNIPPDEMVGGYTSTLESFMQFEEPVAVRLNGREAVYQKGVEREGGGTLFVLAIDMGDATRTRGLLTARMAEGEFEKWEEILFKMAGSLKIDFN